MTTYFICSVTGCPGGFWHSQISTRGKILIFFQKTSDHMIYRQIFLKSNDFKKWISTILPTLRTVSKFCCCCRKDLKKSDQMKRSFYPLLFKNNQESWQKSEYPLCKIIASQKNLPVMNEIYATISSKVNFT